MRCGVSGTRPPSCAGTRESRSSPKVGSSINSSLAVTTVYRGRLEEVEDLHWGKVAAAIGVGLVDDSPGWNLEGPDQDC